MSKIKIMDIDVNFNHQKNKIHTNEELYKYISDLERVVNSLTEELRDSDDNFAFGKYKIDKYGNVINTTKNIPMWVFELRHLILQGYHPCRGV
jgi:hypothetical protein